MSNDQELEDSSPTNQKIPPNVQEAMASPENAKINREIAVKYGVKPEEIIVLVNIIGRTILKEISLWDFPFVLKEVFQLDSATAKAMSLEIATRRFYPLKDHFGDDIEKLILKLGGQIPKDIPAPAAPPPPPEPAGPPPKQIIHKDVKTLLKENKEAGEQLITVNPITIAGQDQQVRPTLKNWLSDYIRTNGTGPHSSMVRMDYLYNYGHPNAQNLSDEERKLLAAILRSYDENTPLPISNTNHILDLEEIGTAPEEPGAGAPKFEHFDKAPTLPAEPEIPTPPPPAEQPAPARPEFEILPNRQSTPPLVPTPPETVPPTDPPPVDRPEPTPPQPTEPPLPPKYTPAGGPPMTPLGEELPTPPPIEPPPIPQETHPTPPIIEDREEFWNTPHNTAPTPYPEPPRPTAPPLPPTGRSNHHGQDKYLESLDSEEYSAPPMEKPPHPHQPTKQYGAGRQSPPDPRISGNIIDLSSR